MSFSKLSPATITNSVVCLNHMHRLAILISIFSNADKNTVTFTFGFQHSAHYLINSTNPAAPKPNVKSCKVCLCMILFFTLYLFVSAFVLSFTLRLLNTFNHQPKETEVAFLKGFNAAPRNGRTDGATVMTMSSVLIFFLAPILLRCYTDITIAIMIMIITMILIIIVLMSTTIVIYIIILIRTGVGLVGAIAYHGKLDAPAHHSL